MLVPLKWLKQYADIDVDIETLRNKMIMTGNEVAEIKDLGKEIENVVVGLITKKEAHKDADRLSVCQVDVGSEVIQIVTGATNIKEGDYIPVAVNGAKLPGGVEIKKGKLRGEISNGMMCSANELAIDASDYDQAAREGILVLKQPYPLGKDIKEVLGLDEIVIEFETLANRYDLKSVIGMAREASAMFNVPLKLPSFENAAGEGDISDYVKVTVVDPDLCTRYMARAVKNIKIEPSPQWMQVALTAAGVRPINNIVDITNYVMMEMGQPMHAFDMACVRGNEIIVRRAKEGEELRTLDSKVRTLPNSMLTISDKEGAIGLAGIMGGENSEIKDSTEVVLFESAVFNGTNIRQSANALGLQTEAAARFAKGVDFQGADYALERAVYLVELLGAGEVVGGKIDIKEKEWTPRKIETTASYVNGIVGTKIDIDEMVVILNKLGIDTIKQGEDTIVSSIPSFREDMIGAPDVAEEVIRIYGYEHIPYTLMGGDLIRGKKSDWQKFLDRTKELLVDCGLYEAVTYSFTGREEQAMLTIEQGHKLYESVEIINPLGEQQSLMRTTMATGMLKSLAVNVNRKNYNVGLFEVGRVYLPKEGQALPDEKVMLSIGLVGKNADFFTLKGIIEAILEQEYIFDSQYIAEGETYFHPLRKATVKAKGKVLGEMGEIHPTVAAAFGLDVRTLFAEIDLKQVYSIIDTYRRYKELPKYPAVERDLALIVDKDQQVGPLLATIKKASGKLLEHMELFDIYEGENLGVGKKSVAVKLILRAEDRTLKEDEIAAVVNKVLKKTGGEFGAELRS